MTSIGYILLSSSIEKKFEENALYGRWVGECISMHIRKMSAHKFKEMPLQTTYTKQFAQQEEIWITTQRDKNDMPRTAVAPPGNGAL